MEYTIASANSYAEDQLVDFDKAGDKYLIYFYNSAKHEGMHKEFDTMAEALAVFQKFVEAFVTGCHSYETRKSWLQ